MARKFLYVIAGLVLLFVVGVMLIALFQEPLTRWALTPGTAFDAAAAPPAPDYADPAAWAALPDRKDAADQVPDTPGVRDAQADAAVDVFFIAPTTFYSRAAWNAAIGDKDARQRIDDFVLKYQASAFNGAARIYAPLYRQATLAAFFPGNRADGDRALDLAYGDVERAFDWYMAHDNHGRPFILAAHSQGSRHLVDLLRRRIDGTALADRMVAAYAVGDPLPMDVFGRVFHELKPCATPTQTRCVITWNSFSAEHSDPSVLFDERRFRYGDGEETNAGKRLLCVNPLRWDLSEAPAPASANLGALPVENGPIGKPDKGLTGARCQDGVLYVSPQKQDGYSGLVMPGGRYHVYDYNLFYMNIRRNVEQRVAAYLAAQGGPQPGT
ncbi:MAG: DUF3089 domain-containing protein [Alphaproteobacteria bacterium]|nr:DUF3089 domain-containing protein [Alphaproteobacteria bacterium]